MDPNEVRGLSYLAVMLLLASMVIQAFGNFRLDVVIDLTRQILEVCSG